MIIFGTRQRTLSGQTIETAPCPDCGNNQFVTFGALRYFHLYWIPTFITGDTIGIECTQCNNTYTDKELPKEITKQIWPTVFKKTRTIPMFSGAFLIACFIAFVVFSVKQDNTKQAQYMNQPALYDIYVVDFTKVFNNTDPEYKYGAMRIKNLSSRHIEFQISQTVYTTTSGVTQDIRDNKTSFDSYYYEKLMSVNISAIKEMKESGAISSIKRKQ